MAYGKKKGNGYRRGGAKRSASRSRYTGRTVRATSKRSGARTPNVLRIVVENSAAPVQGIMAQAAPAPKRSVF